MQPFTTIAVFLLVCCNCAALELRVMTYNIHHAEGTDGILDLDRIARVIQAADADVVCLQEVDRHLSRTKRMDMPNLLAKKLGMHFVFGSNYDFDDGHYGNLTLSRYPITSSENIPLPNPNNKEPRGCLRTDIRFPADDGANKGSTVSVFNTHLGLNSEERRQQAAHILSRLPVDSNVIVAGDLNETTEATGLQLLLDRLSDADTSDLKIRTSPARNPKRRIDYILQKGFGVQSLGLIHSDEIKVASDHLPLVAELDLNP